MFQIYEHNFLTKKILNSQEMFQIYTVENPVTLTAILSLFLHHVQLFIHMKGKAASINELVLIKKNIYQNKIKYVYIILPRHS